MNTPDLSDKYPDKDFLLDFQSYSRIKSMHGQVSTVFCPDDNSLVREMLSEDGQQKILFVDGVKSENVALLGDNLVELAKENNWRGIIVNGRIRDAEIISKMDIAVFALGTCPRKSNKNNSGKKDIELLVDELTIKPNDWIYADINGILLSDSELEI
ncbi:MAG: ribonuclease E inhibitor RraA [Gammaproteobacteria bacterium TMED112]|nr:MAG: ribonuclease E inhibitor RraA [Gammaproteobacteria bacterium TMED112]|tara:strand:+ start:3021 stop:3491 length:471 start_codon:yes stop_codon:yes gene_type:complete